MKTPIHSPPHALLATFGVAMLVCGNLIGSTPVAAEEPRRVIIFVWDGFRPDSLNPQDTPNLYAMREAGVHFTDHHATYPTFTMMNAASFATGSFGGSTGYYGNTLWQPTVTGKDSASKDVDYRSDRVQRAEDGRRRER